MDLEEQIKSLRKELEQKSKDLQLAAEIGNTLLEQNKDLEKELEKKSQTHCSSIEELEQQKYSLQMKLNAKEKLDGLHASELESVRVQIEKENLKKQELIKTCHEKEMLKAQETNEALKSDLERATAVEVQLKEKVKELQKLLNESHERLHSQEGLSETATEETIELHTIIADLEEEKAFLRIELKDKKDELLSLLTSKESIEQQMAKMKNELMQKEKESTSYYNALEKCREEVVDLQLQLDNVKLESLDTKQKGNSLFGEVDDKRKEIERKYISMKVQYEGSKEQLLMKKQQINKMKFQIATLLQMSASRADSSHMEHLREQLNQSQFQVKTLLDRLNHYEQKQVSSEIEEDLLKLYNDEISAGGAEKKAYTDYLKQLIAKDNEKLSQVQKELQTQRMFLMSKSDSLMTCERKLYAAEVLLDQERAKNMKLVLKIDELKRKISPELEVTKQAERKTYIEKLPIKPKETNTEENENVHQTSADVPDLSKRCEETENPETEKPKTTEFITRSEPALMDLENDKNIGNESVIMKTKKPKKSVSVAETVDVVNEAGEIDQVDLKTEEDCQHVFREESVTVGKRGGKRYHKVLHVRKENECAQQ